MKKIIRFDKMLMSGCEDPITSYNEFEDLLTETFYYANRKNSFIDLLTTPIGLFNDNLIDLQTSSIPNELDFSQINIETKKQEVLELNLDEIFEQTRKKSDNLKILVDNSSQKGKNQMIGTLTVAQRKEKIEKYLEKRKKRTWRKRIYYDCRKRVADNRLRIKGRFVTREQAINILGPDHEALKDYF